MPNCVSPPELSDAVLLRFLDEPGNHEVKDHLHICEYCSRKLRNLDRGLRDLTRRVYRSTCPPSMELTAYHLGELPDDENSSIRDHLELCAACREEIIQFDQFRKATVEHRPERESLLQRVEIFVARLLDVGQFQVFAGVRSAGDHGPRIYEAGAAQITITVEEIIRPAGRLKLTGLLLGVLEVEWTADLWLANKRLDSTAVDQDGEFSFESLEKGLYTLILHSPEREIHIQDIRI